MSLLYFQPMLEGWCTGLLMPLTTGANGVAGWPNCLKLKSIIAERSHPLNSQTAISHHGTFTSLNATRTHRKTNSRKKSLLENNRAESLETPDYTCLVVAGMCVFVVSTVFFFLQLPQYDPSSFSPIIELGMSAKALLGYHSYHLPSVLSICASIWMLSFIYFHFLW